MTSPDHGRPRVAFVSTVHPHPWAPGKGTFNRRLLLDLHQHLEMHAIVPVPWMERRGAAATIATGYPMDFSLFPYLPRVAPLALAGQLEWSLRSTFRRVPPPDLVLGYWSDPDGTVAVRWAKRLGVPVVLLVGGSDVMLLAAAGARRRRILGTIRAADHVFTIGRRIREVLLDAGIETTRTSVFARGVDRRVFSPGDKATARRALGLPASRPILLWVGRMVPVKGLDVLLTAMAHPRLRSLDPLLVLAGDGPEREALARQAAAHALTQSVRWVGQAAHESLPVLYRAADLVVLPSRSEGVPNVLLEALACGTPFVASNVGSVQDLVEGSAEILVPPDDPVHLAQSIVSRIHTGWNPDDWTAVPDSQDAATMMATALLQLATQ